MTDAFATLEDQAGAFADELTATVQTLVATAAPFRAKAVDDDPGNLRFVVQQDPATGIVLCVDAEPLLTLKVNYRCELDSLGHYLAVNSSGVSISAVGDGEPLLRYEYLRDPKSQIPGAHLQVHAHRDSLTYVMSRAGDATTRGKRLVKSTRVPRLSHLHLPLGGSRFRPCLEDILELLVSEFGIDHEPAALETLRSGREAWRRKQVATIVRDVPEVAAETLRALGYGVVSPEINPSVNSKRLREL